MVTQELIAYVRAELNKGKTREEIRANLLGGGGWSEAYLEELWKIVALPKSPVLDPARFRISPIPIILALLAGLCFLVFYFYRPQISVWYEKGTSALYSLTDKISEMTRGWTKKEEVEEFVESAEEAEKTVEVIQRDCGITNSPNRGNIDSYSNDPVLGCLGESAMVCVESWGTINDHMFPSNFKIINAGDRCMFELSYGAGSDLVDIFGRKLALKRISCPLSMVKVADETNPEIPIFFLANKNNPASYAAEIYFYGTLWLFIENDFNLNKIRSLGCSGEFVNSMIESYNLMKEKI